MVFSGLLIDDAREIDESPSKLPLLVYGCEGPLFRDANNDGGGGGGGGGKLMPFVIGGGKGCLLYTSPSPRDRG